MNRVKVILLFLIAITCNKIYAGNPNTVKPVRIPNFSGGGQFIDHKDWNFVENKGQLMSSEIHYYGHNGDVYLYCKPGKISFVFTKIVQMDPFGKNPENAVSEATGMHTESPFTKGAGGFDRSKHEMPMASKTTINRTDLVLLNSNHSAQILASDQQEYYENYYTTGNADSGITNVHTFKTVTYKDVYPNIDMVLHAKESGMKYEFVVYPGGKVSDIQMRWNGLEGIKKLKDSKIEYCFSLGKMSEIKPVSFQGDNIVASDFIKHSNVIGFKVNRYDKGKVLLIDPTLEWATYFGKSGSQGATKMCADASGNIYIPGSISNGNNIATSGVYQTSYGGGTYDAFIAKFNSSGKLLWASYFGGSGEEGGLAASADGSGNVFITGYSASSKGIATKGAHQTSNGGGICDAFLAKFDGSGGLIWATYYGGSGADEGYGISTDIYGNVYITGWTNSSNNISTPGAYKKSTLGGFDVFLAKFGSSGNLIWATYYGGLNDDDGYDVSTDPSGNVYMTGYTGNRYLATFGAFQTSYSAMFLAKFGSSGNILWATYCGGIYSEGGYGVATDGSGNVYVTGWTDSSAITTTGAYQTSYGGGSDDAYLAKFSSSGNLDWATFYGGSGRDEGHDVCTDAAGNVYITGQTNSSKGIATPGSYQASYQGASPNFDAFLAKFNSSGNLTWATYYGGGNNNFGFGVTADRSGNVYMCGETESNGLATTGAYQTVDYGIDGFVAKFGSASHNDAGIASILSPKDSFCPGLQNVNVQIENYGNIVLDSVKIGWSINGIVQPPYNWSGKLLQDSVASVSLGSYNFQSGTDTIKAWTSLPNGVTDSFPGNNTAISIVNVYQLPTASAGPDTTLCYNETYTMQGAGGITYLWAPAKYLSNDTIANPKATLPNTQLYTLVVRNSHGCADSSRVLLTVRPIPTVKIIGTQSPMCYGAPLTLFAIGSGGDSLHYSFNWPDDSAVGDTLAKKIYYAGWHSIVLKDNCSQLPVSDSVYIDIIPKPIAGFNILNGRPYLTTTDLKFNNQSKNAVNYLWFFGDGDTSHSTDPNHIYTDSGEYKIILVAYAPGGCGDDTSYGFIQVISKQITIYIPNAFSPNGDGTNDVFNISGVGIKSYSYNIYNRWGEHIYNGTSTWDGTFKGEQVPEGVYIYMFDVVDIFGAHHYLSGNIMLMR